MGEGETEGLFLPFPPFPFSLFLFLFLLLSRKGRGGENTRSKGEKWEGDNGAKIMIVCAHKKQKDKKGRERMFFFFVPCGQVKMCRQNKGGKAFRWGDVAAAGYGSVLSGSEQKETFRPSQLSFLLFCTFSLRRRPAKTLFSPSHFVYCFMVGKHGAEEELPDNYIVAFWKGRLPREARNFFFRALDFSHLVNFSLDLQGRKQHLLMVMLLAEGRKGGRAYFFAAKLGHQRGRGRGGRKQ